MQCSARTVDYASCISVTSDILNLTQPSKGKRKGPEFNVDLRSKES